MHRFIRKNEEYLHSNYKVRIIKADLAKSENINLSEIILVYKNIIFEDSERIMHYNVGENDYIWFGTKEEYDQEFGHHITLELQADVSIDAIAVAEKVLVKPNDKISHVRLILAGIYNWITKVKFSNHQKLALQDDQSIKECQLIDHPIITIGCPILKVLPKKLPKNANNDNIKNRNFGLDSYHMSESLEQLKLAFDTNKPNGSLWSRAMNFIVMKNPEDDYLKTEFTNFLTGWLEYFEREENNCLTEDDKVSIYRQDYSGHRDEVTNVVILGNFNDHTTAMQKLYFTVKLISQKYFPKLLDNMSQMLDEIFEGYLSNPSSSNYQYAIVDLRLITQLTDFINQIDKKIDPPNPQQLLLRIAKELPEVIPLMSNINKIIFQHWEKSYYSRQNSFQSVYVEPNLDKDRPELLFSNSEISVGEAKAILSGEDKTKEIHLASSNFNRFYKDDEVLPTDENLASITVSEFDNFKKLKLLGKGGWGSVSLYKNELRNKKTVLKKLKIPENKKLEEVNEVIREIIAFSKIAPHRRIIQYLDYFIEGRSFYIEMEYMEGGSLKSHLNNNGALNEQEMKHFAIQILEGLKYLHDKSIFHRDIKADNVLLDKDKNAKLTDFGLAKCLDDNSKCGVKEHSGQGTKKWMAPELFESRNYDSSADIWSFGMTMIEMVTGKFCLKYSLIDYFISLSGFDCVCNS